MKIAVDGKFLDSSFTALDALAHKRKLRAERIKDDGKRIRHESGANGVLTLIELSALFPPCAATEPEPCPCVCHTDCVILCADCKGALFHACIDEENCCGLTLCEEHPCDCHCHGCKELGECESCPLYAPPAAESCPCQCYGCRFNGCEWRCEEDCRETAYQPVM